MERDCEHHVSTFDSIITKPGRSIHSSDNTIVKILQTDYDKLSRKKVRMEIKATKIIREDFVPRVIAINKCKKENKVIIESEKIPISFQEWTKEHDEIHYWISFFLQLLRAIDILATKYNLEHNDLHAGNIMFKKTDEQFINYLSFKIPTYGFHLVLIDFGEIRKHRNISKDYFSWITPCHNHFFFIRSVYEYYDHLVERNKISKDTLRKDIGGYKHGQNIPHNVLLEAINYFKKQKTDHYYIFPMSQSHLSIAKFLHKFHGQMARVLFKNLYEMYRNA